MEKPLDIKKIVEKINETLPVHSMWDGFWINKFKRSNLQISCSFDRIYYRNFDLVFKKVIFFNLPAQWNDTNVPGDHMLRLSNRDEFFSHHPYFDPLDKHIFAIDLHFDISQINNQERHTFFILASKVFLFKCEYPDDKPMYEYEDPFDENFTCKMNRVIPRDK